MPQIDSNVVALLSGILAAIAQLIKGAVLSEEAKRWLPLGITVLGGAAGAGLAFYYGSDPVAGLVGGIIAGLSALGLYANGKAIIPKAINTEGWIRRNKPPE